MCQQPEQSIHMHLQCIIRLYTFAVCFIAGFRDLCLHQVLAESLKLTAPCLTQIVNNNTPLYVESVSNTHPVLANLFEITQLLAKDL